MLLTKNIEILPVSSLHYEKFKLVWSFGGNSSIISLFNDNLSIISTEHWISDCSDFFSFDKNNEFVSLDVSVSNNNFFFNGVTPKEESVCGKLKLIDNEYTVKPMEKRFFDYKKRRLICFSGEESNGSFLIVRLHAHFSLILKEGFYVGYILEEPLIYLSNDKHTNIDNKNIPDEYEYKVMNDFMRIMSDNRLNYLGDDMSLLVNELYFEIKPKLNKIKSSFRRNIISLELDDLLDFYS